MMDYELSPFNVDVALFAGQNSNADPRVMDPGAASLVENGRFQAAGQIQKRYGYKTLRAINAKDGRDIRARQIFVAGKSLFAHDGESVFLRDEINNVWRPLGGLCGARVHNRILSQTRQDVAEIASAATDDAALIVWRERDQLLFSIVNTATGNFVRDIGILAHTGIKPNVVACNGSFYATWIDPSGPTIKMAVFPRANLGSKPEYRDAMHANYIGYPMALGLHYDLCASSVSPYLVISLDAGDGLMMVTCRRIIDDSITFAGAGSWGGDSTVWCYAAGADTCVYGNSRLWVSVDENYVINTGLMPEKVRRVTGAQNAAWLEKEDVGQVFIQSAEWSPAAGFTESGGAFRSNPKCYFASRGFSLNGTPHVWVLADFKFQSQMVLLSRRCEVVGRALTNGQAAPYDGIGAALPHVTSTSQGYFVAARRRARLQFDAKGVASTTIGATLVSLRADNAHLQSVSVANSIYISGAAPKLFDGAALSELGFYFYADTPELKEQPNSGKLSAGVYTYALCYAWYDNAGKLWRSALILIPVASNKQPTGSSGGTIEVSEKSAVVLSNIRFLQGSAKRNVFIEIYRTRANLAQLYKIAEIANVDELGMLSTTYTDDLADDGLVGETSYTDGSAPSYLAPPALAYIAATPNRVYGLATETSEVWVSNVAYGLAPAQFLLGQTLEVPTLERPPTCIGVYGGGLYIFSPTAIMVTNADGNYLATAGILQFQPPRLLPVDAGCVTPASLVHTDLGLWFQSPRGIMLLEGGQRLAFVGEPVKNYTGAVLSAFAIPAQQQLRFVQQDAILVFDYFFKRWVVHTGDKYGSGARYGDEGYISTNAGLVKAEEPNSYKDDGRHYTLKIVTPWLKPAGVSGYARCWRALVLGEGKEPHNLKLRIAYQYDDTWIDEIDFSSALVSINGTYGKGDIYGRNGIYGGTVPSSYQFEIVMPKQKATSYRFEITEEPEPDSTGQSVVLNVLSLRCGAYPGMSRLPASKVSG